MKACEPVKPILSPPPAATPKSDNVRSASIFKNLFSYIVHTIFPLKKVKNSDMSENHAGSSPSGSITSGTGSVENVVKKTTKCRLPVFVKRVKVVKGGGKVVEKSVAPTPVVSSSEKLGKTAEASADSLVNVSSALSMSKSLSCHLLVAPKASKTQRNIARKRTSENSVQVVPQKKVTIANKPALLSRGVQVLGKDGALKTHTTQSALVSPSFDKPSPVASKSSLSKCPIQKKRTFPSINPPLLRNKGVVAAAKKPPEPLRKNVAKPLTPPASSSRVPPPPKVTTTNSAQTIESWPVLQKRLGLFERAKRKLSLERKKATLTSTHVQAVEAPVKRAHVKCSVCVQQGSKGTLARIAPSGLERVESSVNTETADNSRGIQCDIALRRSRTPKRMVSGKTYLKKPPQNVASVEQIKAEQPDEIKTVVRDKQRNSKQTEKEVVDESEGEIVASNSVSKVQKEGVDKCEYVDMVHFGRKKSVPEKRVMDLNNGDDEVVRDVGKSTVIASSGSGGGEKKDLVTVLSNRLIDSFDINSEVVCHDHHYCSDFKVRPATTIIKDHDDPLHCINEFISLEHMLHRLQDEIHGLDKSIRQISNNYQFPSVLTTTTPGKSFDSKIQSVAGLVRNYQNELNIAANEQFSSACRRHSFNEYH